MENYSMLIMMVAIFAIMYFFMILPQQKKQKEIRNFQNSLTDGGVYGVVKRINIEDNTIEIEVSRGVNIVVERSYVFANAASQQQR